jgi:type III pantothenate kinase
LPLKVAVDNPSQVGIDRLLNAVAANTRRNLHAPAIMVDAGTAITVDYVDEAGVFRGGAIMPGLTLMAKSLHDYTALLPLVPVDPGVSLPGGSTVTAMQAGIFWSVAGGILELIARLKALQPHSPAQVFLTGGDAMSLRAPLPGEITVWPTMTLEGLRIASWAGEDR